MQRIDKYELLEEIGKGAMGAVYKAFHPHLKKYVAIKEVRSDLGDDVELRQRFEREAELLAQLPSHPNIVTVRDALLWEGRLYVVMDYIDGETLADVIKRGGLNPARGHAIIAQILSGLEAIHRRGIIHRDLKPSNILIDREGTAYISDFGIADSIAKGAGTPTRATAKYAAPEIIDAGLGRGKDERQADIYAAGMLSYETLLGADRFHKAFADVYNRSPAGSEVAERWLSWHTNLSRAAPGLAELDPSISRNLARVVERMMAKNVNERYRDVVDARRDLAATQTEGDLPGDHYNQNPEDATVRLDQLRRNDPAPPQPPPPQRRSTKSAQAKPSRVPKWAIWATAAVVLVVVIAAALYAMQRNPGVTLVINGAAPDSEVFVGDARRGMPLIRTAADGSRVSAVMVYGLRPGESYPVCVSCSGGAAQLLRDGHAMQDKISGNDGETIELTAKCQPASAAAGPLDEIDYHGKMRLVRASIFLMGDNQGQPNEKPVHPVNLDYNYYIDQNEVTNKEYQAFCQATGRTLPVNPIWDPQFFKNNPNEPVVGVSWDDANAYAQWAGKQLPTEAEWEKAASWDPRATDGSPQWKRRWPWGNSAESGKATFKSQHPTPAGQNPSGASAYGVNDMAGNVAEWVADYYQPYAPSATDKPDQSLRVIRGGSFNSPSPDDVRSARRFSRSPAYTPQELAAGSWLIGFRCAVRADDQRVKSLLQGPSSQVAASGSTRSCAR
jgi:formylglycine-generating enzyme required for sulfatase activity/serine/threonine protein kinase